MRLTELGRAQAKEVGSRVKAYSVANRVAPSSLLVSRYARTVETAAFTCEHFPQTLLDTAEHHEVTYLSPVACLGLNFEQRRSMVDEYWARADVHYLHGRGAETFHGFAQRVVRFADQLEKLPDGWHVVFGHGQFFSALIQHWMFGYDGSSEWMLRFRRDETNAPIANATVFETLYFSPDEYSNVDKMRSYVGDDAALQARVWDAFRSSSQKYETALSHALRQDDCAAVNSLLHRIKPSIELMLRDDLFDRVCLAEEALHSTGSLSGVACDVRIALGELCRSLRGLGSGN